MDLNLTDSQTLLVDSAQRFFTRGYPLEKMREIFLMQERPSSPLWSELCDLGWNAAAFPEEIGGFDGGLVEAMLLLIEMGRNACITPFPHSTVATGLALRGIDDALCAAIANSQAIVLPVPGALVEKGGSLDGDRLSLRTLPVAWADEATHFLVEAEGRALLVRAGQSAIVFTPLLATHGEPLFSLTMKNAEVRDLGAAADIFPAIGNFGAFACAALLLGISERALELAVDYAKEREQFGRPIGSFQAIQHKAADMKIVNEVGRSLVMRAAAEQDAKSFGLAASRAKSWTADNARKVTRDAMQIFGGISFCGDHPIQMYYQFVITLANHYGVAHEHREAVAATLLGEASNGF